MTLLPYIIQIRCRNLLFFNNKLKYRTVIGISVLLILSLSYGFGTAAIFNYLVGLKHIETANIQHYLYVFIFSLIVISSFFPQYKPHRDIFIPAYPVPPVLRSLIQCVYNWLNPLFIYLTVTLICFYSGLHIQHAAAGFFASFFLLLIAGTLVQIIKLQISKGPYFPALAMIGTIGWFAWKSTYFTEYVSANPNTGMLLTLLFSVSVFCFNYYGQIKITEGKNYLNIGVKSSAPFTWLFKKSSSRVIILAALSLKLLIYIVVVVSLVKNRDHNGILPIIIPFLYTPVIYFTYLFNNLFGFHPQIAICSCYYNPLKNMLVLFLNITLPYVLADLFISGIMVSLSGYSYTTQSFLFVSAINCLLVGFISSVLAPKKIIKAIDFQNMGFNTSFWANLIIIGLVISEWQMKDHIFIFWLIEFLVIGISMFAFFRISKNIYPLYKSLILKIV